MAELDNDKFAKRELNRIFAIRLVLLEIVPGIATVIALTAAIVTLVTIIA